MKLGRQKDHKRWAVWLKNKDSSRTFIYNFTTHPITLWHCQDVYGDNALSVSALHVVSVIMTIQRCTGFECWTGAIQLWFKIRATATLSNWNTELHTFSLFKAFTPPRSPVVSEDLHFEMSKSFSHFPVCNSTFTFEGSSWRCVKVRHLTSCLLCAQCVSVLVRAV